MFRHTENRSIARTGSNSLHCKPEPAFDYRWLRLLQLWLCSHYTGQIFASFWKLLRYSLKKYEYYVGVQKLFWNVPSGNRSPICHTICNFPFWFVWGSVVFLLRWKCSDPDHFENLSYTERFTFKSGAELSKAELFCSGAETASKAAFLAWIEVLSGTLSATLHFTIHYCVNTTYENQA